MRKSIRKNWKLGAGVLVVVLFFIAFVVFDIKNFDRPIYKFICGPQCTDYYDIPFLEVTGWLSLIISIFIGYKSINSSIKQSNKQVELSNSQLKLSYEQFAIEQKPHVVLDHIKRGDEIEANGKHLPGNIYGFSIKNVGRGPAIRITFSRSKDVKKKNAPFFNEIANHSANFSPFEESHYWLVDAVVLDGIKPDKGGYAYLYVFFENQVNYVYRTQVKIKKVQVGGRATYKVMENKFEGRVGV